MKTTLSKKELVFIASMLFGLFFGAGNLIFPIYMGQMAGRHMWQATIGFLITGVGLPLMGVAAMGISRSNGLIELSGKVSRGYSVFFTGVASGAALAIFSGVFFLIVLGFSLFPGKILTWVGKILNPLFLLFLGVLVVAALVNPIGEISSIAPDGSYVDKAFSTGFLEGYNTMDALASLAFGIIVIDVIRGLGIQEPKAVAKNTVKAGVFSCLLMALIYLAVTVVGAQSRGLYEICNNGGEVFALVSNHYFGKIGAMILAAMVCLACLKTAVGLVTSCAETFCKLFPKFLPYRAWAVAFSVVSFLIANLGLDTIIAYSLPVLMFLYPLAITLILLGLCGNAFGHSRCVYGWVTGCTLVAALYDFLNALLPNYQQLAGILQAIGRVLPLSSYGLGWILPAVLGLGIGLLVWVAKGKPRQRPDAAKTA